MYSKRLCPLKGQALFCCLNIIFTPDLKFGVAQYLLFIFHFISFVAYCSKNLV